MRKCIVVTSRQTITITLHKTTKMSHVLVYERIKIYPFFLLSSKLFCFDSSIEALIMEI